MDFSLELKALNELEKQSRFNQIIFNYRFKEKTIRCIYIKNSTTLIISITDDNIAWQSDISNGTLTKFIPNEVYISIRNILGKDNNDVFFDALCKKINSLDSNSIHNATNEELINLLQHTKTNHKKYDNQGDKPFFFCWKRNTNTSSDMLNKIQRTFGRGIREQCYKERITALWKNVPTSKSLDFLHLKKI